MKTQDPSIEMFPRRQTRRLEVGGVAIGGGAPVVVQAMTKTDTRDVRATAAEVRRLERAGAEIVRLAVPDREPRPPRSGRSASAPACLSSPTSISTTVWPWPRSTRASTACGSIRATSARLPRSARSSGPPRRGGCPSASASTRAPCRRTSWPGPGERPRRPWSRAPSATSASSRSSISGSSRSRSRPPTSPGRSRPTASWPGASIIPSTPGSPRRGGFSPGASSPRPVWRCSSRKGWPTPSGSP